MLIEIELKNWICSSSFPDQGCSQAPQIWMSAAECEAGCYLNHTQYALQKISQDK